MQNPEHVNGGKLVYRAAAPAELSLRDVDGSPVLEGRMMPYSEWTEIRSRSEGHFMERFAPGALRKSITEQAGRIRALFEHGMDSQLGKQPIAAIDEMWDEDQGAHFRASLLEGLPSLIVSGLRRGLYGSSIRFEPLKWDRVRSPEASDFNQDGIEERTIREASIREFSVVAFPAYAGATATIRSITEEMEIAQYRDDPQHLADLIDRVMLLRREEVPEEPEPEATTPDEDNEEPEPEPVLATTRAEPGIPRFQTREEWLEWISRT